MLLVMQVGFVAAHMAADMIDSQWERGLGWRCISSSSPKVVVMVHGQDRQEAYSWVQGRPVVMYQRVSFHRTRSW